MRNADDIPTSIRLFDHREPRKKVKTEPSIMLVPHTIIDETFYKVMEPLTIV